MAVLTNPAGYIVSGAVASGAGNTMDTRRCANYGYLQCATTVNSALVTLQGSVDEASWMTVGLYTAVTTTATAQIAGYWPYVRGTVTVRYGDATAYAYFAPGLT